MWINGISWSRHDCRNIWILFTVHSTKFKFDGFGLKLWFSSIYSLKPINSKKNTWVVTSEYTYSSFDSSVHYLWMHVIKIIFIYCLRWYLISLVCFLHALISCSRNVNDLSFWSFFWKIVYNKAICSSYKMDFMWPISPSLLSVLIMAGSIQLFQSVQKYYQTLGIHPDRQSNLFNYRNSFAILCYFLNGISALAFFLCKASTVSEYGGAIYSFISQLCILYTLFVQIWQMPNILKLIAAFEEFISQSQYNYINIITKIIAHRMNAWMMHHAPTFCGAINSERLFYIWIPVCYSLQTQLRNVVLYSTHQAFWIDRSKKSQSCLLTNWQCIID